MTSEVEERDIENELHAALFLSLSYIHDLDRMVNNRAPGWAFQFNDNPIARQHQKEFENDLRNLHFETLEIYVNPYYSLIVIVQIKEKKVNHANFFNPTAR